MTDIEVVCARSFRAAEGDNVCPHCGTYATFMPYGRVAPHKRYANGCGYGPDQLHTLVECEGHEHYYEACGAWFIEQTWRAIPSIRPGSDVCS